MDQLQLRQVSQIFLHVMFATLLPRQISANMCGEFSKPQ